MFTLKEMGFYCSNAVIKEKLEFRHTPTEMSRQPAKEKPFQQYNYDEHAAKLKLFVQHLLQQNKLNLDEPTSHIFLDDLIMFDKDLAQLLQTNVPMYLKLL